MAVFEVLSPEDTVARLLVKLADYARMGIWNIFVIDFKPESAYRYEKGNLDLCQYVREQLYGTEAVFDWDKVRELLNDKAAHTER